MPEIYPSRAQARWAWRILVVGAAIPLLIYMISITSLNESRHERNVRGLHATNLAVAMVLSRPTPSVPLRVSLSDAAGPVLAACTIKPGASEKELRAALGPTLSARLEKARSLGSEPAIVIFYETWTVVLRATDLSHGLRFAVSTTVCSSDVPTLLVRGSLIDVDA